MLLLGEAFPYIVRVSSSPAARGTRAHPSARRVLTDSDGASPQVADGSEGGESHQPTAGGRLGWTLGKSDRHLLVNLAVTIVVILIITVVLPMLMSLVRNF